MFSSEAGKTFIYNYFNNLHVVQGFEHFRVIALYKLNIIISVMNLCIYLLVMGQIKCIYSKLYTHTSLEKLK